MIYIKNLLYFTAILVLVALGALLFPTSQAQAGFACFVDIEKEATPSDGTDFEFSCTGGFNEDCDGFAKFSLMDGESLPDLGIAMEDVPPGNVMTVVEQPPDGWGVDDISCEVNVGDPDEIIFDFDTVENGVFVTCTEEAGEALATCTFRNIKQCSVIIEKKTLADDGTLFDFTAPGSSDPDFALANNQDVELLIDSGENVDVTEIVPGGWVLEDIECSAPDGVAIADIPDGRNFTCNSPGGTADCVFINKPIRNIPTLSEWGLVAMAGVLGIIGFIAIRRRKAAA